MLETLVSDLVICCKQLRNRVLLYERCWAGHNIFQTRLTSSIAQNKIDNNDSFIPVYKFPPIRVCATVSRLKIYQTAFAMVSSPISVYLHCAGITENIHVPVISVGIAGCIAFFSFSYLANNVIGAVYANKKTDIVKISYLNFWGNRIDTVCFSDDILPLPEDNRKKILPTAAVQWHSSPVILYLPTEHGDILDQGTFDAIFFKVQNSLNTSVKYSSSEKP